MTKYCCTRGNLQLVTYLVYHAVLCTQVALLYSNILHTHRFLLGFSTILSSIAVLEKGIRPGHKWGVFYADVVDDPVRRQGIFDAGSPGMCLHWANVVLARSPPKHGDRPTGRWLPMDVFLDRVLYDTTVGRSTASGLFGWSMCCSAAWNLLLSAVACATVSDHKHQVLVTLKSACQHPW